jgi:hypothetical protein
VGGGGPHLGGGIDGNDPGESGGNVLVTEVAEPLGRVEPGFGIGVLKPKKEAIESD